MTLTILGLVITTLISVIGVLTGGNSGSLKAWLLVLTLAGFGLAIYSAVNQRAEKARAQLEAKNANALLNSANARLEQLRATTELVRFSVGDLAVLNRLSEGNKYYVRIAAGRTREELEDDLQNLYGEFRGASESGMVGIREPKGNFHGYQLVFGQNLSLSAAEVFQRLATSHHLAKGFPQILAEPPATP